jgi:hypothetical protein
VRAAAATVEQVEVPLTKSPDGAFSGTATVAVDGQSLHVVVQLRAEAGTAFSVAVTLGGKTVTKKGTMPTDDAVRSYDIPLSEFRSGTSVV